MESTISSSSNVSRLFLTKNRSSKWLDCYSFAAILDLIEGNYSRKHESSPVLPVDLIALTIPEYLKFDRSLPGMIYVFGGRCSKVLEPHHYLSTAEMYDHFRNEWIRLPDMKTRRVGAASVELNGKIYVIGGYCLHPDKPLGSCEVFDPEKGTWSQAAELVHPRFGHAVASFDNRYIFVVGGDSRRSLVSAVERYDLLHDKWEVVCHVTTPVAGGRMLERNAKLYLVGGDVGSQPLSFTDKIKVFDPPTLTWETLPCKLQTGRSACAVSWCQGASENLTLAVIGGYAANDDAFFELDTGESVDICSGNTRAIPSLSQPRAGCRAVQFDKFIYIVGGESPGPKDLTVAETETASSRQVLLSSLRGRLLNLAERLQRTINANSELERADPTDQSDDLIQAILAAASPIQSVSRVLHDTTLVFDTLNWCWSDVKIPAMMQPRTASAVCLGRGYPRYYSTSRYPALIHNSRSST
jgi:hypothetical protein